VDELTHNLADHRRRIRRARAADAAMRAAFYVSIAGCLALAVSKFAGVALPVVPLAGALAAVPAALAIREWTRSFSLRDCAIHLDRLLGLDERLSTAVEAAGPMESAVKADAAAAIGRSPVPPRKYPREAGLLIGTLVLAATLAVLPSPERSGGRGDPALQEVAAEQAARIQSLANVDVQFQELKEEAARALRENRPEQALALMEELRRRLEEQLLSGDGANAEALQKALDRLAAAGAAVSAELARLGRIVHAPPPAIARAKLERQKSVAGPSAPAATADAGSSLGAVLVQDIPWSLRYEPVVRKYRGY
jgi:hypothetical protein